MTSARAMLASTPHHWHNTSQSQGDRNVFPSVSWVSQQGKHVAGFDIAPGAAGVGIGPAAAVPAPSVEGFSSNGFSGAPPMMGSNPGLSLGELYPQEEVVKPCLQRQFSLHATRGNMNMQPLGLQSFDIVSHALPCLAVQMQLCTSMSCCLSSCAHSLCKNVPLSVRNTLRVPAEPDLCN